VIGDTAWDAVAARNAGLPAIGLLSGGFGDAELRDAGCGAVYADAAELASSLDDALAAVAALRSSA
jgi:phosphoglycolate phosphatase-like HAD superfamily hydrolase